MGFEFELHAELSKVKQYECLRFCSMSRSELTLGLGLYHGVDFQHLQRVVGE